MMRWSKNSPCTYPRAVYERLHALSVRSTSRHVDVARYCFGVYSDAWYTMYTISLPPYTRRFLCRPRPLARLSPAVDETDDRRGRRRGCATRERRTRGCSYVSRRPSSVRGGRAREGGGGDGGPWGRRVGSTGSRASSRGVEGAFRIDRSIDRSIDRGAGFGGGGGVDGDGRV